MEVADTGERILLEKETPMMIARHSCAYNFAKDWVSGKSVLDVGSGEGYGSYYLAGFAKEVTGIDYDEKIIYFAREKYQRQNLRYLDLNAERLDSLKDKFDVICSFQCIEHIPDVNKFLKNISGLLKESGIFICSTPNRLDASPGREAPLNKFHLREYLLDEYRDLLKEFFSSVELVGVKRSRRLNFYRRFKKIGFFNFLPKELDPVKRFYGRIDCGDFIITKENLKTH